MTFPLFSSVHSPWLPGYTDVVQTILVLLTMVGLFPDRPCIPTKHGRCLYIIKVDLKRPILYTQWMRKVIHYTNM